MNIVDYLILGVLGISVLFGIYRGFISSVLNTGGCIGSLYAAYKLYPSLSSYLISNTDVASTLLKYTDASSRIGDLELSLTKVTSLTSDMINTILQKVQLPYPLNTLLQVNLEQQVYSPSGLDTVSDYVSQTIASAGVNIICFLLCFAACFLVISIVGNLLKAIFKFPLLKQLDWLAGAVFGLLRGALICYAVFALVPLIETVVPMDSVTRLLEESSLASIFNNGNMILSIMNGKL